MATTGSTPPRESLNWFGLDAMAAALPLSHFALSVGVWLLFFGATLYNPLYRPQFLGDVADQATFFGPALMLLVVSVAAYSSAVRRRRRVALRLTAIAAIAAGLFFWADVAFGRWQISVDIATREYWDAGNPAHQYFTWWWYNDRWFAHRAADRAR